MRTRPAELVQVSKLLWCGGEGYVNAYELKLKNESHPTEKEAYSCNLFQIQTVIRTQGFERHGKCAWLRYVSASNEKWKCSLDTL